MKKYLGFFLIIFIVGFVCASFDMDDDGYSIYEEYGLGDTISGWLNIGFSDEPGNSVFSDSYGNEISLSKLMILNNLKSSCEPEGCGSTYVSSNAEISKTLSLSAGESKIIGLVLTGDVEEVSLASLEISSTAVVSCLNQIEVDILNDEEVEFFNTKASDEVCDIESYGCYDFSKTASEFLIENTPYCQKIELDSAPGFKVGAYINPDEEVRSLTMVLSDENMLITKICSLPEITSSNVFSCSVDFSNLKKQDFYVCLRSDGGRGYSVPGYVGSPSCGFYGSPIKEEVASYQIFAKPKKYAPVGEMIFPTSVNLKNLIQSYLVETYGSEMDCSEGCIIPIKIIANTDQSVTIDNLDLEYSIVGGPVSSSDFYDIEEVPAVVDLDEKKVYLDKVNFTVGDEVGEEKYILSFNGEELFSETITIKDFEVITGFGPLETMAGYPTEFVVGVESSGKNVTSYVWEIEDNAMTTTTNKIVHNFGAIGIYDVSVTVTDSDARTFFKTFTVSVTSPKDAIEGLIGKKLSNLGNITNEISIYPTFYQNSLKDILNLSKLDSEISGIKVLYNTAETEEGYVPIMTSLFNLKVPESIFVSESAEGISFYSDGSLIDLDFLTEIGRGDYAGKKAEYINEILLWNQENIKATSNFKEFSAKYDSGNEVILNLFDLDVAGESSYPFYVVVEDLNNLKFDFNQFETKSGYIYVSLEGPKKMSFATTEKIDFINLPVFISPEIVKFSLGDDVMVEIKKDLKWLYFALLVLVLIAIGFGVYIYLRIWYKKKYEKSLFKNQNELYNLISYVQVEKKKGLNENQIRSKLKKSGWSGEKVDYVLKKYSKKNTGMPGLGVKKKVVKKSVNFRRNNFRKRF